MSRQARVTRLPMAGPDDISAIDAAIREGRIDPAGIVAILGKTEGNGCVNDFSRGYAVQSLRLFLHRHMPAENADQVCLVMSGGTEGGLSPHWIVFEVHDSPRPASFGLAIGHAMTPSVAPQDIGRMGQVQAVASAVRGAMVQAGISNPADVHFVQVKCPLLTAGRVSAAGGPAQVATADTLKSMGLSRGASALGVALALGELAEVKPDEIGRNMDSWSGRASCSAGVELTACEIVLMGNAQGWSDELMVGHAVMRDALDMASVGAVLTGLGRCDGFQLVPQQADRIVALLAKAEASPSGRIRGARHTMLDDSDISSTRHARAYVGGALGAITGLTQIFVSGGAEHQGPPGGGPIAIIYRKENR